MVINGNTSRRIGSLVNSDEAMAEFEHIISERDDDELCVLCPILDVVGDD